MKLKIVGLIFGVAALLLVLGYMSLIHNTTALRHVHHHKEIDLQHIDLHDHHHGHKCVHDEFMASLNLDLSNLEQEESPIEATQAYELKRRRHGDTSGWKPIRILPEYTNINTTATDDQKNFIMKQLLPSALGFFQKTLSVYPKVSISEIIQKDVCNNVPIPSKIRTLGVNDKDLVLFVYAKNQSEYQSSNDTFFVRGAPCYFDKNTLRPVAAMLEINLYQLSQLNYKDPNDLSWQSYIRVILHEMTHILGFSQALFPTYINPNTNYKLNAVNVSKVVDGRTYITLNNVKTYTSQYFNCPVANITGAPLENQGGADVAGSHWERATFGNEIMTGSLWPSAAYSQFTLQLLQGTGWYVANFDYAETFLWGQGSGCQAPNATPVPNAFPYCDITSQGNQTRCSFDFNEIARCQNQDILSDSTAYWRGFSNANCHVQSDFTNILASRGGAIGPQSRCFQTGLAQAMGVNGLGADCFKSVCNVDQTTQKPYIVVTIGANDYQCQQDGQVIYVRFSSATSTLTCPSISTFCGYVAAQCPNNCSQRGTCVNNACKCWSGFDGTDCSLITQ